MLSIVVDWTERYLSVRDSDVPKPRMRWKIGSSLFSTQGVSPMSLILSVVQQVTLSIAPVDVKGNPAPIDGAPAWSVIDPTIATLAVAPDGLSAELIAATVGHVQVTVSADARLGPDVSTITGVLEVDVVAAEAVSLGITAGEPVNQPVA